MSRKVKIEFEEVGGYRQSGTLRLWTDDKEIIEPFEIAGFIQNLKL